MKRRIFLNIVLLLLLSTSCSEEPSNNKSLPRFEGHVVYEKMYFDIAGTDATFVGCIDDVDVITIPTTIEDYVNNQPITYTVKYIAQGAFKGKRLSKVNLPSSLISIGAEAFMNCENLISIDIPKSVNNVGHRAFMNSGVKEATINGDLGGDVFANTPLRKVHFGENVKSIPDNAFSSDCLQRAQLTEVTFTSELEEIGAKAFAGNKTLTNVTLPKSLISIGYWAFGDCSGLKDVTLPESIVSMGNEVFANCAIEEISLATVNLGVNPFWKCPLKVVHIKGNIKVVPERFVAKHLLGSVSTNYPIQEVTFEEGVKVIDKYAFQFCNISKLEFPSTLTTIKSYAFERNQKLETIVFGSGLKLVEYLAFTQCDIVKKVVFNSVEPPVYNDRNYWWCVVNVPQQSLQQYKERYKDIFTRATFEGL